MGETLDGSDPGAMEGRTGIGARVDAAEASSHPIADFIFGGFIEHIGNLINHSLWSEVLDDRKFFRAVDSSPLPEPQGPMRRLARVNKWMPLGPDESVTMDEDAPCAGRHAPLIHLAGEEARGIFQSGLDLGAKAYTGRIVVAADPGVKIEARLIWGKGARERQCVAVPAGSRWSTAPLAFSCPTSTGDGRLEISARGRGAFKVGAVSLMPSDNVEGFRADTLALMRDMDCKILRMPGGNFVSGYDWKDTIGDPDKRPPTFDPVWNAIQPNDAGLDELLRLCRLINAEPYWCVNTGYGEPRAGAELVEYVNGGTATEWGARRAANGHPEPYGVRYWNIGNEMYGHWQLGHMALSQYAIKHGLFARAMRRADPSIYIVAPGGFVDEMTTGQGIMVDSGSRLVEYGSERDWAGGMLKHCWGTFDALATHAYQPENKHFNFETGKNEDIEQSLVEWARAPANRIATMADCWEEYKRRFPALNEGRVKVFFDEWAYRFIQDYRGCLAAARALHEFFRHTDFIDMAGYTMGTAWLDCDRQNSCLSASGLLFQLYNRHFGRIPLAIAGDSPVPAPAYPIGGDQPRVNTGSDTWPLDVSAALSGDRGALTIAVVNATDAVRRLRLSIANACCAPRGKTRSLKAAGLDSMNRAGKDPEVSLEEGEFDATLSVLEIEPYGIRIFEYEIV
jgi:alpha-L-arabinofuranosidase